MSYGTNRVEQNYYLPTILRILKILLIPFKKNLNCIDLTEHLIYTSASVTSCIEERYIECID